MTTTATFPCSVFDPIHLGIDENGEDIHVDLAERNMLLGGEPGGGKSNALDLVDGKQVELGAWRHCADMFIGPSITAAIGAFTEFQQIMNARYDRLLAG